MSKIIAYVRVSTVAQDVQGQRYEILEYARRERIHIDDFLEIEISARKTQKARRIEEMLSLLHAGDTVIVSELSRLGRSTGEVINLVSEVARRKIGLVAVKQGLKIPANGETMDLQAKVTVTMFSLMAELERDLISQRTKQALAAKKAGGVTLGKPKGTIQASKLDGKEAEIKNLLAYKVSKAAIARLVGTSRTNLNAFIKTRKLAGEEVECLTN